MTIGKASKTKLVPSQLRLPFICEDPANNPQDALRYSKKLGNHSIGLEFEDATDLRPQ